MEYKKIELDGYVLGVARVKTGGNITRAEYDELTKVFQNRPIPRDGYGNRLKADITWEQYELPEPESDPELSAEQALAELMEVLA